MNTDLLAELCVKMSDELEQAIALGYESTPTWHETANCKGVNNRYWDTGHPSWRKNEGAFPGDPDWKSCNSIFGSSERDKDPRLLNSTSGMSGYKYSVAFSLCGGCDVRVDCGLAAIDEEPQPWAQYLIRGGVTASRRGKLMEQHKAAVAGRPAALYKRMCGNNRCGSVVGSTDPETSLCRECRNVSEVPQAA